jgi:pimeloyl-ACP methyl ester carboxylesterase
VTDTNIFFRHHGKGTPILLLHGVPQHSVRCALPHLDSHTESL